LESVCSGFDVSVRLALSSGFGLVLATSLFLKLPGYMDRAGAAVSARPSGAVALLERHGFQVSEDPPGSDPIWVSGRAGACQVRVAAVAPEGWHRSLVAQMAAGNQLVYMFGGELYSEQPIVRTWAHHYWSRLAGSLGLSASTRPVVAVVATPACENLPLQELAKLSER
jgi:hypothetical protein